MAKGGSYEREICRRLSLWWSRGENDDLFWRTSGSGARATVRGRKGKRTTNHCGDICSTDASSQPLIQTVIFELKRGYSRSTIAELLDCPLGSKQQVYEEWFEQAETSRKNAGVLAWALVHKRDRREPIIFFQAHLWERLVTCGAEMFSAPQVRFCVSLRKKELGVTVRETVYGMLLEDFLIKVNPQHILMIHHSVGDQNDQTMPKLQS